ncbi:Uncharacterized protein Adt_47009 [Abeliophyllum distichum]|uniref:Uncharacterized protein n=1 Tax=Abeliophyllum distichum TaxID=126358 RepID=A0ABD1NWG2_9LAMI
MLPPICRQPEDGVDRLFGFEGLTIIDYVNDTYKKEAYMRKYTLSIFSITRAKSWLNSSINSLTLPVYTKKTGGPKKFRRKEASKERSSSQAKSGRKSSRNTTFAESNADEPGW